MTDSKATKIKMLRNLIALTHAHALDLLAKARGLRYLNARRRAELAALTAPPKPPAAKVRFGLDWAWGSMSTTALRRSGATFACRYLSNDASKNLTPAEAKRLKRAGISIVVVWETSARRALDGYGAGVADAKRAVAQARACGKPDTAPIYFAVDDDVTVNDVASYFRGVISVLGKSRTGAYAGLRVISGLFNYGLIGYGWQTYAWSGGRWDRRAQLQQYSNSHTVGGVDCDYNRSTAVNFGQW